MLKVELSQITGKTLEPAPLGQATSTIIGKAIIGRSLTEVQRAYEELSDMLKNEGPTPGKPFEELYMLKPASEYKNRHASILLALEATLAAFQQIAENDC